MTSILDLINENSDESTRVEYAPYLQFAAVRDSKKPSDYGLFISDENAEKVNWKLPEGCKLWKRHKYPVAGNKIIEGWISQSPRILIVKSSPLSMFSKETGRFVGSFNSTVYSRDIHSLKTKHAVILLDEKKNALHTGSLIYNSKNVAGSTFGFCYKEFKQDYQKVIGQSRQDPFWLSVVFQPTASFKKTEGGYLVGCYTGYKVPSLDTPEEAQELINDFVIKTDAVHKQLMTEYAIYKEGLTFKIAEDPLEDNYTETSTDLKPVIKENKPVDFAAMLQTMMHDNAVTEEDARDSITKDEPLEILAAQSTIDPDDIPF